jgi:peptidoglycan/xylan/chitin deacetylase (PgdA/CDA1 family)
MRLVLLAALTLALIAEGPVAAQSAFAWPKGKRAAIVLTYDDAMPSQLAVAIPQLDAAGLKGTFFLDADSLTPAEMARWRKAARKGHELGNHSVNHPCPRAMLPRAEHYVTETYDTRSMLAEIGVMNAVLFGLDGRTDRTYALPCSQSLVGGGEDYIDGLRGSGLIRYVRTGGDAWRSVLAAPASLDPFRVPSWGPVDHPDGAQLIAYIERVRAAGGLGVLQFHGVGGDYLEVSAQAHQQLLDYLRRTPDVWVAPFQQVMDRATSAGKR